MRNSKKILISAAVLAGIGIGLILFRCLNRPEYEDLAGETKPIYTK
jgi:hypothetical protein